MQNKAPMTNENLKAAIEKETQKFQEYYLWLEKAMPQSFFKEVSQENIMLIAHNLMGFHLQEYFSTIHLKKAAIVLCLDSADADLRILKNYALYGIKNYETYVSKVYIPFKQMHARLRIAVIYFTEAIDTIEEPFQENKKDELHQLIKERNSTLTDEEFNLLIEGINNRFLRSVPLDRLVLALEMFFRAKTRDSCQYEVRYNLEWEQEPNSASMQVVLAWRNTPKYNFLYRVARTVHRHGLVMRRVNATYIDPYSKNSILVMVLGLHGSNGKAAWDVADISDFMRELVTLKYFPSFDLIDETLVSKGFITGTDANVLRAAATFAHQALVHIDPNLYDMDNIEEALCRHPELTVKVIEALHYKFDPQALNLEKYEQTRQLFLTDVTKLDTGHEQNDVLRRNVLLQAMNLVHFCLKTNCFKSNYTSIGFRLDPKYLDEIPFDRTKKFPELPYAIFFMKGLHFFGFHIRFADLARGGLRTVFPDQIEQAKAERNHVFTECYHLAYTQQMKNKDIPEGGAKGIIFLKPYDRLDSEALILQKELEVSQFNTLEIGSRLESFRDEQKIEYLYQTQRSFVETLVTLVNCKPDGTIKAKDIIDYWKRPEYIYLGPDENMHNSMIQWIADYSKKYNYKPGSSFISSKPKLGINHKQYGVTSLGVNVYMEAVLKYLKIDPKKDLFTVKMSGGPDGDVAGNQIRNLYTLYPKTAKLIALVDATGTINDPLGLDLVTLDHLFAQGKGIKFYPPELLNDGGFLLDKKAKRNPTALVQQTLCWHKRNGKLEEEWISGSDMNHLLRTNVHQTKTDVFITAGGRPRTLNESNVHEYLDEAGKPTSLAIIEGANLYLDSHARHALEDLGVLIIKDSSANKTGVICSSFEVLSGLTLGDEKFLVYKDIIVKEILKRLRQCASDEATLLLKTHQETGEHLTSLSDKTSLRINQFTNQILDYLETQSLLDHADNPLIKCFLSYCLPTLKTQFQKELLSEIPEHHKKAIIAVHIAAQTVYRRGLAWFPSVVDILPILIQETV